MVTFLRTVAQVGTSSSPVEERDGCRSAHAAIVFFQGIGCMADRKNGLVGAVMLPAIRTPNGLGIRRTRSAHNRPVMICGPRMARDPLTFFLFEREYTGAGVVDLRQSTGQKVHARVTSSIP